MREPQGTTEVIAWRLLRNLDDRKGFHLDEVDEEVQNQWLEDWAKIIGEYMNKPMDLRSSAYVIEKKEIPLSEIKPVMPEPHTLYQVGTTGSSYGLHQDLNRLAKDGWDIFAVTESEQGYTFVAKKEPR